MKVKRLREEKAARARELWMKAESAAAGKSKREKKMLEAAIKIQVNHCCTLSWSLSSKSDDTAEARYLRTLKSAQTAPWL